MSYTEIFGFDKEGNAYSYGEVKNAFRGAMAIWSILEDKYLPPFIPEYAKAMGIKTIEDAERVLGYKTSRCTAIMEDGPIKEVWNLADNKEVSEVDRICLLSTFDRSLVKRENLVRLIKAFRAFVGDTSLKEQADIIEEMMKDENCIAVGWNQTSVNCDTWESYSYDEENDETVPYNCLKQAEHYWVFDELNLN